MARIPSSINLSRLTPRGINLCTFIAFGEYRDICTASTIQNQGSTWIAFLGQPNYVSYTSRDLIRATTIQVRFVFNHDISDGHHDQQPIHEPRTQQIPFFVYWSYDNEGLETISIGRRRFHDYFTLRVHLYTNGNDLVCFTFDATLPPAVFDFAQVEERVEMTVAIYGCAVWRKTDLPIVIIGQRVTMCAIVEEDIVFRFCRDNNSYSPISVLLFRVPFMCHLGQRFHSSTLPRPAIPTSCAVDLV